MEMICTRITFVQFIILKSSLVERFKFTQARAHIHTYTHKTSNMPSCDMEETGVIFSTWSRNIYQCHNQRAPWAHPPGKEYQEFKSRG